MGQRNRNHQDFDCSSQGTRLQLEEGGTKDVPAHLRCGSPGQQGQRPGHPHRADRRRDLKQHNAQATILTSV